MAFETPFRQSGLLDHFMDLAGYRELLFHELAVGDDALEAAGFQEFGILAKWIVESISRFFMVGQDRDVSLQEQVCPRRQTQSTLGNSPYTPSVAEPENPGELRVRPVE
jgi:hypothetical protein